MFRFTIISVFILFFTAANAQQDCIATAKIFDYQGAPDSKISVVYEDGSKEVIDLNDIKIMERNQEKIDEDFIENQSIITSFLNKMIDKGYEVKSSSSLGTANLIIFRKKGC